jgi:hypothetical protein
MQYIFNYFILFVNIFLKVMFIFVSQWIDYPDQIPRNILNLGICIPDSCSSSDLQKTLQNELDKVFLPEKIKAVVKVDPILCTVKEDKYPYSIAYHITR